MSEKHQQQGFVLVSVLLITSISTFFALSAVSESRLQERIAGNQIKEINARAQAEKGLLSIVQKIEEKDKAGDTIGEIVSALNHSGVEGEYLLSIDRTVAADILKLKSQGEYNDAVAYLNAEMLFQSSNENGRGGIVACKGISLKGSGSIDSYDSRDGAYSDSNANSNAEVVTIDGDIDIRGNINVKGDLTANGDLSQSGSANFGGNVIANGDVSLAQSTVSGNINSNNNVSLTGVTVGNASIKDSGNVSAMGTLELANRPTSVNSDGKGSVNANGGVTHEGWYDPSDFSDDIQMSGASEATMASNKCNELNIETAMPTVKNNEIKSNMNRHSNSGGSNTSLEFNAATAQVFNNSNKGDPLVDVAPIPLTSPLWEGDKPVYVFDELYVKNTEITIVGDVTILVKGDLTTLGGGTGFKFKEGDSNSSLTILVEGQVKIGSSTQVFENATIDGANPKVPLTIYSSFESTGSNRNETAVYLNGATDMYAKVYAPLGNVEYAASGSMMGSLEGKNVSVSGNGSLHYDEALALFEPDPSSDKGIVKFTSLFYHYPNG